MAGGLIMARRGSSKARTWWEALKKVSQEQNDTLHAVRVGGQVYRLPEEERQAREAIGENGPTGYGVPPDLAVVGYGERFIYVCAVYDGATWISAIPREDTPGEAPFVGGW